MLLMVRIKVELPGDMDPARVKALGEAEAEKAIEAINAGKLRKIWRIVGERSNFSIWETETLEEFHDLISSFPLHPWMSVEVTPLIDRMDDLGYGFLWDDLPEMAAWLDRIRARPSFAAAFYPGARISERYPDYYRTAADLKAERGF